ncbi:MAG TPA: sigma-54 dependent transcriptional regulator [candidate division Zixibacteria bacterium]
MEKKDKILVVSQAESFFGDIREILADVPTSVAWANSGAICLKMIKEENFQLIVLDCNLSDLPGRSLVNKIIRRSPHSDILVALEEKEEKHKEVLNWGVDDILNSPLDKEEVHLKVTKLLRERNFLESCGLVGKSIELKKITEVVLQVAPTNITVMITGESGTGKELIARAIHNNSPRKDKPLVIANCGALAEGVLESELFGHEKGAFTGAISRHKGLFEQADGGSIFLDEIGEIRPHLQVKLLRVLEEKNFQRVGGNENIKVDVRVIAATNRKLEEEVRKGNFREDLYFRLSVVKIDIPPLRERTKDIPILVLDFIEKLKFSSSNKLLGISDDALELLTRYHWPGNVRELRNFLESMSILVANRRIEKEQVVSYVEKQMEHERALPVATGKTAETAEHEAIYQAILSLKSEIESLRQALQGNFEKSSVYEKDKEIPAQQSLEEMERELIVRTLRSVRGNRKRAASLLGIGQRTLYRKLDKYGLKEIF